MTSRRLLRRGLLYAVERVAWRRHGGNSRKARVFPDKAVEVIVPTGAGGINDQNARLIQKTLTEQKLVPTPTLVLATWLDGEYTATRAVMSDLGLARSRNHSMAVTLGLSAISRCAAHAGRDRLLEEMLRPRGRGTHAGGAQIQCGIRRRLDAHPVRRRLRGRLLRDQGVSQRQRRRRALRNYVVSSERRRVAGVPRRKPYHRFAYRRGERRSRARGSPSHRPSPPA